jgi:signal recognition particle subunit SRP54
MFDAISERFEGIFARLRGRRRLSPAEVDSVLGEVRLALLEADVNVTVARELVDRVRARAVGDEVHDSLTPGQQVIKIVHEELVATLGEANVPLSPSAPPLVVVMVGLQGSGKTTTAAKLAHHLQGQGRRPLLVAADLQRPAAAEQLQQLGERIGVPVFTDRGHRPPRLVRAALKEAARLNHDAVVIDTAGRMQIDRQLMEELGELVSEAKPAETLLVVDAMIGQEAVNVARGFGDSVRLTGLILTKLDGDARGGAAISARKVTGVPIKFVGMGESLDRLEPFHPERMASRILGMGDVLTLIERAEESFDQARAEEAAAKLEKGQFTLEDFLDQFQAIKRMGPLKDVIAMLPGAGPLLRQVEVEDRDLARVEAIISSMTLDERRNPRLIGASRRRRIAFGSGTSPEEVGKLLGQFAESQKVMKLLAGGRGIPGLKGLTAGSLPKSRPQTARRKKKKR